MVSKTFSEFSLTLRWAEYKHATFRGHIYCVCQSASNRAVKKIVLISCSSKKVPHKAKAKNLYVSPLFIGNLRYAINLKPDAIFILSAKYGLLELDNEIEPYNTTLKNMSSTQVKAWADHVLKQLKEQSNLQ